MLNDVYTEMMRNREEFYKGSEEFEFDPIENEYLKDYEKYLIEKEK
jgi:hypothetical protein